MILGDVLCSKGLCIRGSLQHPIEPESGEKKNQEEGR
jgi:hypothetical protein